MITIVECPLCEEEFELFEDLLLEDEETGDEYVWCPICEEAVPLEEFWKEYKAYKRSREDIKGKVAIGRHKKEVHGRKYKKMRELLKDPKEAAKYVDTMGLGDYTPGQGARAFRYRIKKAIHAAKRGGQLERAAKGRLKRMRRKFWRGRREELKGRLRKFLGLKSKIAPKSVKSKSKPVKQRQEKPVFKPKALLTAGANS